MKIEELRLRVSENKGIEKVKALLDCSQYHRQGDLSESIDYAIKAEQLSEQIGFMDGIEEAQIHQIYTYFYHSQIDKAEERIEELLSGKNSSNNPNVRGTCHNIKGRIKIKSGKTGEALRSYLKALDYYLQKSDFRYLMSCYNNIGTCYQEWEEYDKALEYFQLAYNEAEKCGYPGKDIMGFNIGCIQYSKGSYSRALDLFERGIKYFRENNMQSNLADAYLNMGLCFDKLGARDKALSYFNKALELKEKLKDYAGMGKCYEVTGNVYLEMGDFEEAKRNLDKAAEITKGHGLEQELLRVYEHQEKYWERLGEYRQLSEIRKEIVLLRRQVDKKLYDEKLSELETKYQTEIYKNQNRKLDEQNRSMQNQILKLKEVHEDLKQAIKDSAQKLSKQDSILSSQSRMALMGEMISMIAHQWKQPLNIIGVLAQSFEDAWEWGEMTNEYVHKQVKLIMDQISYMSETINDFRSFFKRDKESLYDLGAAIKKGLKLLNYMIKQHSIKLELDLADNCEINGNPNDMIQVVLNIVNNAIDAILESGVSEPEIKVKLTRPDQGVFAVSIYNNGGSVEDSILGRLFEPYFTTKGEKGTGIGLYICRMVVENKYRGQLSIENKSEGVEVLINLPSR